MRFRKMALVTALLLSVSASASYAQTETTDLNAKKYVTDELYLKCEDKARLTSGYIGLIPKQYNPVNSMDAAFDNTRSQGLFDFRSSSFKQPYQSARVGGKITFKFGSNEQLKRNNAERKKRRNFRTSLNDCFLANK